ncbi:MAG: ABC transporter ATP-binding protein, partial [Firmicutes bacterium]|nr:ABC transporter ATP-binding protein [Bacillota bacterium]
THDLSIITEMADRIAIMYAGKLVEEGPIDDIFHRPTHPYTVGLLHAVPSVIADREAVRSIPGTPPDGFNLPPGCRFASRCPLAVPECTAVDPRLMEIGPDRRVACHRWKEVQDDHSIVSFDSAV